MHVLTFPFNGQNVFNEYVRIYNCLRYHYQNYYDHNYRSRSMIVIAMIITTYHYIHIMVTAYILIYIYILYIYRVCITYVILIRGLPDDEN